MTRLKPLIKYLTVLIVATSVAHRIDSRQTVVDGDTMIVGRQRIRLNGIDAPEMKQTCVCQGKTVRCGVEAKKALAGLIGNKSVFCESSGRDVYGRLLAECFVTVNNEKISLNLQMIRAGMAVAFSKNDDSLLLEESEALRQKKGFWNCEKFEMPSVFRKSGQKERSI